MHDKKFHSKFMSKLADVVEEKESLEMPKDALELFKSVFPDWMTGDEWREAGEPKGQPYLYPWQERVLKKIFDPLIGDMANNDKQIKIALAGGNGVGKTALLAVIAIMHVHFCYLHDTKREYQGAVYSGSDKQLKSASWRYIQNLAEYRGFNILAESISINRHFQVEARTWNKSNLESVKGMHAGNVLVMFDEGTAICDEIYDRANTFSTDARFVWVVTANPEYACGRFYEIFTNPGYQKTWICEHISIYDSNKDGNNFAKELIAVNGPDSDIVRICVHGHFPLQSSSSFFQKYYIDQAIARECYSNAKLPCCIGIDFASERGKDFSVIAIRDTLRFLEINKYKVPLVEFMRIVYAYIHHYQPKFVAYDAVGMGEGPSSQLIESFSGTHIRMIPVFFGGNPLYNLNCQDRRTECLYRLKEWMREVGQIPNDHELINEMLSTTYSNAENHKIKCGPKKEVGKSPDKLDACAYTHAANITEKPDILDLQNKYTAMAKRLGFD